MIRRTETARGGQRPITAIFAAALIVFIQLVGTSHYHNLPGSRHAAQTQVVSADSELCPVCLIAFHAPAASSPAPAQHSPEVEIHSIVAPNSGEISEVAFEYHLGRAPPASL